jgi:hypothetical protein
MLASIASPPPAADGTFFRGLNLNGPELTIDGNSWEGKDSRRYTANAKAFENQSVKLSPETDEARARMTRSSRWGDVDIALTDVPSGDYQIWLYVWEDNDPEKFTVLVAGRQVVKYTSGPGGRWEKLGPFGVRVTDGAIRIATRGGATNVSGIEVHRTIRAKPTAEAIAHFEKRIRPLLVKRCYECHSAEADEPEGGLLLDTRAGIERGGYSGPAIEPGDPDRSRIIKAVRYVDKDLQMPPAGKLSDMEIAELEAWVKAGATDPRDGALVDKPRIPKSDHWSLKKFTPAQLPAIKDAHWAGSPVDRFVRAAQEAKNIAPVAEADRATHWAANDSKGTYSGPAVINGHSPIATRPGSGRQANPVTRNDSGRVLQADSGRLVVRQRHQQEVCVV